MYKKYLKRPFDLVVSLIGLPFFIVLIFIVAPLIYFSDKGSIFYNAKRLGKNGKVFKMYKFRTMKMNAPDIRNEDGSTFNSEKDPRLTKIGRFLRKTSVDEIPQILNVLKGDMSLIGPRPDLPDHLLMYTYEERKKISMKPGITGFNQAYFRNSINYKKRWKNDIYYVENVSLLLDFKIILKTIKVVLQRKNING